MKETHLINSSIGGLLSFDNIFLHHHNTLRLNTGKDHHTNKIPIKGPGTAPPIL